MKPFSFKSAMIGTAVTLTSVGPALAQDVLKWGHTYEVGSVYHQAAARTAEAFEEATGGKYKIDVFPASQLGNEASLNEALSLGTVDVIYSGPTFMSQSYGPIVVSAYPFALRDFDALLQLQPHDAAAWFNKGFVLEQLERWEAALEAFARGE